MYARQILIANFKQVRKKFGELPSMKVYNKKEFLKLPTGIIFCKGVQWAWDDLSIKGESWDKDFLYIDLCNIDAHDTNEWCDRLEDSLKNGCSYPINKTTSRDGCFDPDDIFLVFEKEDLQFMKQAIEKAQEILTLMT